MQVYLNQLTKKLPQVKNSFFFIHGDCLEQKKQAKNIILEYYKKKGFNQTLSQSIDQSNDWNNTAEYINSNDLFGDKMIIYLKVNQLALPKEIEKLLESNFIQPNPDIIIIIETKKLTTAQKKSKLFTQIDSHGAHIPIYEIKGTQFIAWIEKEMIRYKLKTTRQQVEIIAAHANNNLIAAKQLIEQLGTRYKDHKLSDNDLIKAISPQSKYTVFELGEAILAGQIQLVSIIIDSLFLSNTEPTLILWVIHKEINILYKLNDTKQKNYNKDKILSKEWQSRKALLQRAAKRIKLKTLSKLIRHCVDIDLMIKGFSSLCVKSHLKEVALACCINEKST